MAYNYLWLVNRLCQKFNEVELTSSTFANAAGVYADFKSSINAAIKDLYQDEDNEWPFGWHETTFVTTIGDNEYNKHASAISLDWDSFRIKRVPLAIYTLTQTSGTATATVTAGHQLVTGDSVYISGANQDGYVGSFIVTVVSPTVFTFEVDSSTVSPATGTIIVYPPYSTKRLKWIDIDAYREEGREERDDNMIQVGQYSRPQIVVRKTDNNFLLSPKPDRIYTVAYDYFSTEADLVLYTDVPTIPEEWKEVIVKGGVYYTYLFRDNIEEAAAAKNDFKDAAKNARRILIPIPYFMRVVD